MKSLDELLEEAIGNVQKDREVTKELLDDVFKYLSRNEAHHREVGAVAAKYVETLQIDEGSFSIDKEAIFDMIHNNTEEETKDG